MDLRASVGRVCFIGEGQRGTSPEMMGQHLKQWTELRSDARCGLFESYILQKNSRIFMDGQKGPICTELICNICRSVMNLWDITIANLQN